MENKVDYSMLNELKILNLFGLQTHKIGNSQWAIMDSNGLYAGNISVMNVISEDTEKKIHMLVDYGNLKCNSLRVAEDENFTYTFFINQENGVAEISIRLGNNPKLIVKFNESLVSVFELSNNFMKLFYNTSTKTDKINCTMFFYSENSYDEFCRNSSYVVRFKKINKDSKKVASKELGCFQADVNTLSLVTELHNEDGKVFKKCEVVDGTVDELVKNHDDSLQAFQEYRKIIRNTLPFNTDVIKYMFKVCKPTHPVLNSLLNANAKNCNIKNRT